MSVDDQLDVDESVEGELFGIPKAPDPDLVKKIQAEALIQAGFVDQGEDGEILASYRKLQNAVVQVMHERHIVRSKKDFNSGAVTKFELYQEMLPDAPGVQSVADTVDEKAAQDDLMRKLWTYLNTGTTGFVQKNAAGEALVLCEGDVPRTKINEENGRREPRTEKGRFLTDDGELILTYYTGPAGAAFIKQARKLEAQLGMVGKRRPELAASVAKQVGAMVKQAVTSVPHADPRQVAALTAGNGGDAEGDQ
ncbi:MAG: hypothetical protein ACRDRK_08040 [Pseudonocardia sp.]